MSPWLCNVLISDSNCLDPYIRLELFRLFRLFQGNLMEGMESESTIIASTMIKAISEIEPRNLYLKLIDSPDCLQFDFTSSLLHFFFISYFRNSVYTLFIKSPYVCKIFGCNHLIKSTRSM